MRGKLDTGKERSRKKRDNESKLYSKYATRIRKTQDGLQFLFLQTPQIFFYTTVTLRIGIPVLVTADM